MPAKNDITGDEIKSKGLSKQGRDNWDRIFKKQNAHAWLKELGYNQDAIIDPDGWRYDEVDLDTPITRSDFFARFNQSTVRIQLPILNNENK